MLDTAEITIKAGDGGDGLVSFRREKYIPKGGPWGGDGGDGGDIILQVDSHYNTLATFRRREKFLAENGKPGMTNKKKGKDGDDLVIPVPPGTVVKDQNDNLLYDLTEENQKVIIVHGGQGGLGNVHFKSSTNRTPMQSTEGRIGDKLDIKLELKLIADIGLIGLPSSGKSTLLNSLTRTNVKTAEYHFTTLEPNLGVLNVDHYIPGEKQDIILADIPGLIEGASEGKGLGHDFLRHIERTNMLVHILDGSKLLLNITDASNSSSTDIENTNMKNIKIGIDQLKEDYKIIRNELKKWNESLVKEEEIIVINKLDLFQYEEDILNEIKKAFPKALLISAVTRINLEQLVHEIIKKYKSVKKKKDKIKEESVKPSSDNSFNIDNLPNKRIVFR